MAFHSLLLVCIVLTFSLSMNEICGIYMPKVVITNVDPKSPGGVKFEKIIGGIPYTKELMTKINKFVVLTLFQQTNPADQRKHENETVYLNIKDFMGAEAVAWGGNKINVSGVYLDGYRGDLKWEFTSLLYHEFTHLLAWGSPPSPLREGIADYAILKANYFPPAFAKQGSGDKWDQGYDFTARFYEYCDSITPGFAATLNKMCKDTYNVKYFQDITGKPVEQLWKDYKAKYAKKDINT